MRELKLLLLFLIPILMLNLGYGLDLVVVEPHALEHYTSSINIDLDLTVSADNNGTCWYEYYFCHFVADEHTAVSCKSNNWDVPHEIYRIDDCADRRFNLQHDGHYNLNVYAQNDTAQVAVNRTITVERAGDFEEGKPVLAGIIILIFLGLSFLFIAIGKMFKEEGFQIIKSVLAFGAVLSGITTVNLAVVSINEFLKIPTLDRMIGVYSRSLTGVFVFVIFIVVILFMFNLIKSFKEGNLKSSLKKW